MPAQTHRRAAAALYALAVAVAGCGGGNSGAETTPSKQADPESVAVLGSNVAVDPRRITLSLRLRQPEGVDPPIARTATVVLQGKGIDYDGAAQATCDAATIRSDGMDACPKGAIIGTGEALGKADTATTKARITIVNGGRDRVLFSTVIRNPAYVKAVVPGRITPGDERLTIAFTFPRELQNVAGVPVGLQQLNISLNRGGAVTTARCDSGWRYDAAVAFADDSTARHQGRAAC